MILIVILLSILTLNLSLVLSNILLFSYTVITNYYFINILYFIATISFILYYLDNFNLSKYLLIKSIQTFSFVAVVIVFSLFVYDNMIYQNVICCIGDMNNNIGTHVNINGQVNVSEEKAGNSIAITGAMVGVAGVVGKAIAKAPMPPLQKAGAIVGASVIGGAVQAGINRFSGYFDGSSGTSTNIGSNIASNINKFLSDSELSPLQGVLWSVEIINYACLSLVYILIIQLVFKLYFKDNVSLNLSKLLGNNLNDKVEFYLNKMIKLNKQISILWIWFGLATVFFGLGFNTYFITGTYIYLDKAINTHNPINNNIGATFYGSIEEAFFNLGIVNYICLAAVLCLMVILYFKFRLNKNINTIYVWLLVILLIVTLAYFAYISGDLYSNIDSYVNIYNNLKK